MQKIIFSLLIFFIGLSVNSQNSNSITINLDIDTKQFKTEDLEKIPFDQAFFIKGSTKDKKIKSVKVKYKVFGGFTDKHYFVKNKPRDAQGYVVLGEFPLVNQTFTITSDMLHSNEVYEYVFEFKETFELAKDQNDQLKSSILNSLDETFNYKKDVTAGDITAWVTTVDQEIRIAAGNKKLYDKNDSEITDFTAHLTTDPAINTAFRTITTTNNKMYLSNERLTHVDVAASGKKEIIYDFIEELKSQKAALNANINTVLTNAHYKKIISEKVNLLVDSQTTLKDVFEIIYNDNNRSNFSNLAKNGTNFPKSNITDLIKTNNSYLFSVLLGDLKIKGPSLDASESYDIKSGELLLASLFKLQNIKKADGTSLIVTGSPLDQGINNLTSHLIEWIREVRNIEQNQQNIKTGKARYVKILNGVYSQFSFKTTADTSVDIETKESPYLGIDFGVLVAPAISSTFLFEGINFHLSPVNRRAKYSDLEGWDEFYKRVSVSFGVAQRVGSYDDNYENLIGVGSPFAGLGVRLNRMIRINGGVLFYKTRDPRPNVSDSRVNGTYYLSASVDIKLKDALQIIGNFIK